MKIITFYTALTLWVFAAIGAHAQNEDSPKSLVALTNMKEEVVQEEKNALKIEVEKIHERLQKEEITTEEAEILKEKAAQKHALNIENRIAIIDNRIALIERNGEEKSQDDGSYIAVNFGNKDSKNERVFGISIKEKNQKVVYDKRTTSDAIIAFGLNNVITEGESLEDSDFKVGGSRFFEIGWVWNTRILNESNFLRLKYGLSFQFNGLKPTDNRFFVDTGNQTELETFPLNLKKSKLRMDNLVIPVHIEFGPSKKIEHKDYIRYSTRENFKFGIGGYGGINLNTRQKLKYEENGEKQKQTIKANYNTNNFVYGVSGYIGWGAGSIYAKYDLNPIFKKNEVAQRNISLGLRLDLH